MSSPGDAANVSPGGKDGDQMTFSPALVVFSLSGYEGVSSGFSPKKPKVLHIYCYRPKKTVSQMK